MDFLLDLYLFCNNWNYFNVGNSLFKQVKGVSMGCYFSKEISDLVLLYSEYKYGSIQKCPLFCSFVDTEFRSDKISKF